jgi:hypothetical protein
MTSTTRIHWIRILIAGFLAEAAVFVVVIPVLLTRGRHPLLYVAPVASFVMCFLFAIWVGRRLESQFVLHGILIGLVSTLIYVGLTRAQPEPAAYLFAHLLKIAGGAVGGLVASRQKAALAGRNVALN